MLPIFRTDLFVSDLERQISWYLRETELDEIFAAELAQRFAAAVEETLEYLSQTDSPDNPTSLGSSSAPISPTTEALCCVRYHSFRQLKNC